MPRIVALWALFLASFVQAGDGDFCAYNNITGFCVTADAQHHNQECAKANGWLQFYISDPSPRVYRGCGEDGVVLSIALKKLMCSMHVASSCPVLSTRDIALQQIAGVTITSGIIMHSTAQRPTKVIS